MRMECTIVIDAEIKGGAPVIRGTSWILRMPSSIRNSFS